MKNFLYILIIVLIYIIFILALTFESFYKVKYREEGFTPYKDTIMLK